MTPVPTTAPTAAARTARAQAACKYLVLAIFLVTVLGVFAVAGAQDGAAPAATHAVTTGDITAFGDMGVKGVLGWQALLTAQRGLDAFGRLVTAVERIVSEGVKVEDVRTHASAVVDLADAVRSTHRDHRAGPPTVQ